MVPRKGIEQQYSRIFIIKDMGTLTTGHQIRFHPFMGQYS